MNKGLRETAKALYNAPNSICCKVCVKCKEKGYEQLSCVDCIEDGLEQLIDRATPMKPTKSYISIPVLGECVSETYDAHRCPKCGNTVYDDFYEDKQEFCSKCWQAIDWCKEDD